MKKVMLQPLVFLALLVLLVGTACGFSIGSDKDKTDEPAIVETDAPIVTNEAATEAPAVEIPADEPPDFFLDEFENGLDNYSYFLLGEGDEKNMDLYWDEDKIVFDLNGPNLWPYVTYDPYIYTDVRIDVEAENLGNNNNMVTMLCRYDEDLGWYEFNITNSGLYWIYYYDNVIAKDYINLYNGGSTAIKMGRDTNVYTAICEGTELSLYINGVLARSVEHKDLKEGQVGFGVSSFENYPVKVNFNWFEISQP